MIVMGCNRSQSNVTEVRNDLVVDSTEAINENDSFTVVYRQPVNGYKVKAVNVFHASHYIFRRFLIQQGGLGHGWHKRHLY